MAYSTSTSIYTMLPGLNTSAANTAIIDQYKDRVAGKIDNFVIGLYDPSGWTSQSTTPPGIIQISDAIVAMWTMRSLFTRDGQNKNDWVEELGKMAGMDLKKIASGELKLADNNSKRIKMAIQLVESTTEDYSPTFNLDSSENWETDPDQLDAISDDRE